MDGIPIRKPLFKEASYQSSFQKDGFVKVPLLMPEQADRLAAYYNQTRTQHETVENLHHTTTDTQNPDLILEVDRELKSMLVPALQHLLVDFKPLVATFHVKEPGEGSATGIHQDPTFVDEDIYDSANVWVALQDIDEHNGNLFFVRGSNRIRALRITPECPNYYDGFRDELPQMRVQVPLRKGEAVVFHNATIHGATENRSKGIRLASTLLVCSGEAQWLLYYRDRQPDAPIEKYHMDLDAFVSLVKNGRPEQRTFGGMVTYRFPQLTKAEFLARTQGIGVGKKGYLQRIKKFFSAKTP